MPAITLHQDQDQDMGRPNRVLVQPDAGAATVGSSGHATRLALSVYDELEQS